MQVLIATKFIANVFVYSISISIYRLFFASKGQGKIYDAISTFQVRTSARVSSRPRDDIRDESKEKANNRSYHLEQAL